jgi:hypothetical protein
MDLKVTLTIHNDYELISLLEFLKGSSITSDYIPNPLFIDNYEYTKFRYIPTAELKYFCGSENLNQKGCISIQSIVECIIKYAKQNKLLSPLYIELDSKLREILKTELHEIKITSLPSYIMNLLERVNA